MTSASRQMVRCCLVALSCLAGLALADSPEDEWAPPPVVQPTPPLVVPPLPPEPPRAPLGPFNVPVGGVRAGLNDVARWQRRPVVGEPNTVSMFGAPALGAGRRGQALLVGFPLVSVRAAFGVSDRLDLGLGFDTFYGSMNEVRGTAKFELATSDRWHLAASVEGGWAGFVTRARQEVAGARWITGRRNGNFSPGLVASYQGPHPRAARVVLELRYLLAFDTEPYSLAPLDGVPRGVVLGHNVQTRLGAELPLSPKTSFVFLVGLDVHGRTEDSVVMPSCSVGVVTGL